MPINMLTDDLQIPRGQVYLDILDANDQTTGEEEFGNCPGTTINVTTEKAEHYGSRKAVATKDASRVIRVSRTGKITCDNLSLKNLARFYAGDLTSVIQASGSVTNEVLIVRSGRHYQIGKTANNPAGVRNISAVVVEADADAWVAATAYAVGDIVKPTSGTGLHYYRCTVAGTSHATTEPTWPTDGSTVTDGTVTWEDAGTLLMVEGTDYDTNLALGRLQILDPVGDVDTPIVVDYTKAAANWDHIATGAGSDLRCAIRIVADNTAGANRDHYMPLVVLSPDGDLPIITDANDYVQMTFSMEILEPVNGSAIYVDGRPA